jgi:hypothetical protein
LGATQSRIVAVERALCFREVVLECCRLLNSLDLSAIQSNMSAEYSEEYHVMILIVLGLPDEKCQQPIDKGTNSFPGKRMKPCQT